MRPSTTSRSAADCDWRLTQAHVVIETAAPPSHGSTSWELVGTLALPGSRPLTQAVALLFSGFKRPSRWAGSGRHRTAGRTGAACCRTARVAAWPSIHRPTPADRCRDAAARRSASSLHPDNSSAPPQLHRLCCGVALNGCSQIAAVDAKAGFIVVNRAVQTDRTLALGPDGGHGVPEAASVIPLSCPDGWSDARPVHRL